MGTKNKPGDFDCYANAAHDEPMFVLLGRDPMAGELVRLWAELRERNGEDPKKVAEARACANAMDAYATEMGKVPVGLHNVAHAAIDRLPPHFTPTVMKKP